jgi:hypothetical protein
MRHLARWIGCAEPLAQALLQLALVELSLELWVERAADLECTLESYDGRRDVTVHKIGVCKGL